MVKRAKAAPEIKQVLPLWPDVKLPFERELQLDTLLEDQIIVLPGFFSKALCSSFVQFVSTLKLEHSPAARRGEAHRTNDRYGINDPAFAGRLWRETGLARALEDYPSLSDKAARASGLNPNIRVYRYEPGQCFNPHYDESVRDSAGRRSEWTLLIYLTGEQDGVQGGETAFYDGESFGGLQRAGRDIVVSLDRGAALLHRHGAECLLHEGRPVLKGVKWVLRSDVMFSR
ncbi:uncharacterized protein L969DRAFT_307103 [Mixia osmundae IAM 14324]|uniref:Fe2OG dioxygenase domain-containing protein n=1 Tax=Mixia osmundae (strain CBS 9802 / IAM 14324 / JCM 22182 / KY 12970) TaxID=764103 RepID=G7DY73_MIXOS|nr:uncharacterized protein L969DRAFT_307103 [Mixia osmundae IAM 14324]KEI41436.1 hypothetical protein L969DRAFT_307103 [Mixia osmundae IAM 14324]GAA95533.1 hypothetical protein E5Q_02188 [Mixia osmundae IAM 14324]